MIQRCIEILSSGKHLSGPQMEEVMEQILLGQADTPEIVSFLSFLSQKGESVEELIAAVRVMRHHAVKINSKQKIILDTCGTGGDALGTFNISTAVAFVAAGCGITVAKHGNRSVSSLCGSADVLEALGINISMLPARLEKCLDEVGIAFLFAQDLHPAMKYAMPARKLIGKRTMFNLLGPLSNPAQATHQLVGVFALSWVKIVAQVLLNLGAKHALVVHGQDGLDEISTTAKTFICEAVGRAVKAYEIEPKDFGFKKARLADLKGGNASSNAAMLFDILNGKEDALSNAVVLNSAAAIYTADKVKSIKAGIALARDSIESKRALRKLELLKEFSNKI